jgi:drug/metabolite transporter (DMT)-like permease
MKYKISTASSDPASPRGANLSKGYSAVFATVFIWSMPSLFMYYLNRYYDPWAQNFYRYSVACIAIAPFLLYQIRRGGPRIDIHAVKLCLLPCLPNVAHQVTQVMALFYIGPGVYTIFTRASVIFTALLALAFFPEERVVIRQWQFQLGTLLGLVGAFGVIWFQANANLHSQHVALPGLFIAFTATFCWALYGVLIKRPSA